MSILGTTPVRVEVEGKTEIHPKIAPGVLARLGKGRGACLNHSSASTYKKFLLHRASQETNISNVSAPRYCA